MVMNRRHREDAFAGEFKTQHLQNDRDRFDNEDTTDNSEEQLLLAADRDDTNHSPNGERTSVTHENARGMTVEPEKTETRADERTANNGQFAGEWIKRNLQILRDFEISRRVGKQRIGKGDRYRATN